MLIADVLAANPAAARVFKDRRMRCAGCTFAPFETVTEAALAYGIDPCELAGSLAEGRERYAGDDRHDDY
jgi:hybrid cluster-associated redox disulfide protein